MHTLQEVIPTLRLILLETLLWNLFLTSAEAINDTTLALEYIQVTLNSLASMVMDDRIVLILLVGQGNL